MPGWTFYRNGQPLPAPGPRDALLPFVRSMVGILEHSGGAVVLVPLDGDLELRTDKHGRCELALRGEKPRLAPGDRIRYRFGFAGADGGTKTARLLEFAEQFGVLHPGTAGYAAQLGCAAASSITVFSGGWRPRTARSRRPSPRLPCWDSCPW